MIIRPEDLRVKVVIGDVTNSKVVVEHIPTGIMTMCNDTKSQTKNRDIAIKYLEDKLSTYTKRGVE